MRNQVSGRSVPQPQSGIIDRWYEAHTHERFFCVMSKGWFIETREGEAGPFSSLQEAEHFLENQYPEIATQ